MNSVPLLLRHSLRSSSASVKPNHQQLRLTLASSAAPRQVPHSYQLSARSFSVCLRCQFRRQSRLYETKQDRKPGLPGDNQSESVTARSGVDGEFPVLTDSLGEDRLPSETEGRRSQLSKKFTDLMDNIQSNVFIAGQRLNDLTGYSAIEKLKRDIELEEQQVAHARSVIRQAKEAYSAAINRRSASQREVNELLQRKHAWSPADLERFTSLYRSDHANEVAEAEAQEALTKAEREVEEASSNLNRSILARYHEEQIWSDKIRRMSTWGTWGLMGMNVLLFLIFQVLVEPWRRQRLVKGFEEKVKEAIETEAAANRAIVAGLTATPNATTDTVIDSLPSTQQPTEATPSSDSGSLSHEEAAQIGLVSNPVNAAPVTVYPESLSKTSSFSEQLTKVLSPENWRQTVESLFSERHVALTQRELTAVVIQSVAAGAAMVGVMVAILRPH